MNIFLFKSLCEVLLGDSKQFFIMHSLGGAKAQVHEFGQCFPDLLLQPLTQQLLHWLLQLCSLM